MENTCIMLATPFYTPVDLRCIFDEVDLVGEGIIFDHHITVVFAKEMIIPRGDILPSMVTILGEEYEEFVNILSTAKADTPEVRDAFENLTATTLRNIIGDLELDETLTSRDTVNTKMRAILDEATDPWGIKVNRVELKNIINSRKRSFWSVTLTFHINIFSG